MEDSHRHKNSPSSVLCDPFFNRGTAFTYAERSQLGITGSLPSNYQTLDQQVARAYEQYSELDGDLQKNTFLSSLAEQNIILYYRLIVDHLKEMFSIIYTPTEGTAIENYSRIFRRPQGCFLDIAKPKEVEERLSQFARLGQEDGGVDYIVVSDGEQILGIGDQGTGAILISVAKLAIATICAGVNPKRTLAVCLDVGTNNQKLLDDKLYLGLKQKRAKGQEYDEFVDSFMQAARKIFPHAHIHFEDFGVETAQRLLKKYRSGGHGSVFNDDIQGTGCVTTASVIAAAGLSKIAIKDLKVVAFGAGSAGTGISEQLTSAIASGKGVSKSEARNQIYCIDKQGLLLDNDESLSESQRPFAKKSSEFEELDTTSLLDILNHVKPHVLLGTSTVPGAFTEDIVKAMTKHVSNPIIFPLSNPTKLHEATPEHLIKWTDGKALVATGSPFPPVKHNNQTFNIGECNNSVCFPGIGLACVLGRPKELTDDMLVAAMHALAGEAPATRDNDPTQPLCPGIEDARHVSVKIAKAVLRQAAKEGVLGVSSDDIPIDDEDELEKWVEAKMWEPVYEELDL